MEGKNFQILGKFARKLGFDGVSSRRDFAVVPVEGFNPDRIRALRVGMEATLGARIRAAAVLDRDYRSDAECEAIRAECGEFCDYVTIHRRKEIENFLLVPEAIDRAAERRVADQIRRAGKNLKYSPMAAAVLNDFALKRETYVAAQYLANRKRFVRAQFLRMHEATIDEAALAEFKQEWTQPAVRLQMIPGKEALSDLNGKLQERYGVNVTPTAIVDGMVVGEMPNDMRQLVRGIAEFAALRPD